MQAMIPISTPMAANSISGDSACGISRLQVVHPDAVVGLVAFLSRPRAPPLAGGFHPESLGDRTRRDLKRARATINTPIQIPHRVIIRPRQ